MIRLADYEIDLGEALRRLRGDWRYIIATIALTLLLLCGCGWLLLPRPAPRAAVVLAGPEGVSLTVGGRTLAGAGPHAVPAGVLRGTIEAPGHYPQEINLELTTGVTETISLTLHPRPAFQEIQAALPGTTVQAAYLTPRGARFAVAAGNPATGTAAAPDAQWWEVQADGRRERLLSMEATVALAAAREDAGGQIALARPEGLFLDDGRLLLTDTANLAALAWWGADLVLFRAGPAGVQASLLSTTEVSPTERYLALLPLLPDARFALPSPGGEHLVLAAPGQISDALLALDRTGGLTYLADLPSSPLPWAYLAWESARALVWAAPQAGPDGQGSWAIRRLRVDTGRSELLAVVAGARGLWLEGGEVRYVDEAAGVRTLQGEALYTMTEIDLSGDFVLWRQGERALLWNAPQTAAVPPRGSRTPTPAASAVGRWWLLSWPGGKP